MGDPGGGWRILGTLERRHATATFFFTGRFVRQNPRLARAVAARFPIGNHTWSHPRLASLGRRAVVRELLRTQAAVVRAVDGTRPLLFRPPYGVGTPTEAVAVHSLVDNAHALVESIVKAKPSAAKGKYLKSVTVSSTMGPGIRIDTTNIDVAVKH